MPDVNPTHLSVLQDSAFHLLILLGCVALLAWLGKSIPSRWALLCIFIPIPLLAVGFWWTPIQTGIDIFNILFCLLLMVDRFLLSLPPKQLDLSRQVEEKLSIHQANGVIITLSNNGSAPLTGTLADALPEGLPLLGAAEQKVSLPPYSRQSFEYQVKPMDRGDYRFGKIHLRYQSRLGLLWLLKKGGREEAVKVYPDLKRLKALRVRYSKSLRPGELRRRNLGLQGTQFKGLRNYLTGEDVRRMDWKATARLETPIVRTYTSEVDQPILLLLDAGRKMQTRLNGLTQFDWALNSALAFASISLECGDQVGAAAFHKEVVSMTPFGSGKLQINRLLDQLHDVQPEALEPDYSWMMRQCARTLKRRSLIVLFTDLVDSFASQTLIQSLQAFSSRHLLMVVTMQDPQFMALAHQEPKTAYQAYERGVALDLLELRQRALRELQHLHGAILIDAPPDRLDETLIQRYLAVKLKNQL